MPGKIAWTDLTVENAEDVKSFYSEVVGWKSEGVSMGDYEDFNMMAPDSKDPAVGICHARGGNAGLPPVWMVYITVENLSNSLAAVERLGGSILKPPREDGKYAVIEDPAGAICTLYEEG